MQALRDIIIIRRRRRNTIIILTRVVMRVPIRDITQRVVTRARLRIDQSITRKVAMQVLRGIIIRRRRRSIIIIRARAAMRALNDTM
jgi:hypothetical protein